MIINECKVTMESENVYGIFDAQKRLGAVVKHYGLDGVPQFRAFGKDFASLSDAINDFRKIRHFKPF